jgi:hypothetical protein
VSRATNPALETAASVLRLALSECEAAAAEIRNACEASGNANYVVGTATVIEAALAHALDLVRAAKTVLLPARAMPAPPCGPFQAEGGRVR